MDTTAHDLKVLSICYYIFGGIYGGTAFLMSIYALLFGFMFASIPMVTSGGQDPPVAMFHVMILFFGVFACLMFGYSACILVGGRFLSQHRRYGFCFAAAVLNCLAFPFGTTLGIFTFLVLSRPSAREFFGVVPPAQLPPPLPNFPTSLS